MRRPRDVSCHMQPALPAPHHNQCHACKSSQRSKPRGYKPFASSVSVLLVPVAIYLVHSAGDSQTVGNRALQRKGDPEDFAPCVSPATLTGALPLEHDSADTHTQPHLPLHACLCTIASEQLDASYAGNCRPTPLLQHSQSMLKETQRVADTTSSIQPATCVRMMQVFEMMSAVLLLATLLSHTQLAAAIS